jgi:hypothetical protein
MAAKNYAKCTGEAQTENTDIHLHSVRLSHEAREAVEAWAKKQPDKPTLPEAIRRLIEQGLATD